MTSYRLLRRYCSDARFVDRLRTLDYWKLHDDALSREFPRSRIALMLDRQPLVLKKENDVRLATFSYIDLKKKLGEYGLSFDVQRSCLLDAVPAEDGDEFVPLFGTAVTTESPPDDAPVLKSDVIGGLAKSLGGRLMDVRMAMLTMQDEQQRNLLAKFQSLTRWSKIYLRCPKCASALRMRVSKSGASCLPCNRVYYPTFSPVSITLLRNPADTHCLLVRHKGSVNGVFTCVAGFAHSGESLSDCARREIAEEVGLRVDSLRSLDRSQPWPMPDSSLMCAFVATVDMDREVDVCPDELECAKWFSRDEVAKALKRTIQDPFLKGLPRELEQRQQLHYIPPHGAIAHHMIKDWVENKISV